MQEGSGLFSGLMGSQGYGDPFESAVADGPSGPARVFTRAETRRILASLASTPALVVGLLYGSGLRLSEALRLRVRDLDLAGETVAIRDADGRHLRTSILPRSLRDPISAQLRVVRMLHDRDRAAGSVGVPLPPTVRERHADAGFAWRWQLVFPAPRCGMDPASGLPRRGPLTEGSVRNAVRRAARAAGVEGPCGCESFRRAFAAHLLEAGYPLRRVRALMGPGGRDTVEDYARLLHRDPAPPPAVREPMMGGFLHQPRAATADPQAVEEARVAHAVAIAAAVLAPFDRPARATGPPGTPRRSTSLAPEDAEAPVVSPYDVLGARGERVRL
jgi:hypothetical protein